MGTTRNYRSYPSPSSGQSQIKVYESFQINGETVMNSLFSFPVEDVPSAMEAYLDKLIVGVGKKLILFEILSKKLLLRAVREGLRSLVQTISVEGEKIIIS